MHQYHHHVVGSVSHCFFKIAIVSFLELVSTNAPDLLNCFLGKDRILYTVSYELTLWDKKAALPF